MAASTDEARGARVLAGPEEAPAPIGPSIAASERCESPRGGSVIHRALASCDAREVERVQRWGPDVLVVLGGGLLPDDEPSCATAQRARAAVELSVALGDRVGLVLSGRGPSRAPISLDPAEGACMRGRLEDELDSRRATEAQRIRERAQLERVLGTNRAYLTEADGMCAAILRRYEVDRWPSLVARMEFDPASTDTVQNALFSTPLIEQRPYRRVLIVTTPVRHASGSIDNHPERALLDFRAARARSGGRYLLGAIGCPYVDGGPSWASFEEEQR